mmetsp:Transcript_11441/g.20887  ORF Transcript_11441/g.20887 Transcript_11441/m.20887 type:complete len:144 (+) Transcript_11441:743-1174(+)
MLRHDVTTLAMTRPSKQGVETPTKKRQSRSHICTSPPVFAMVAENITRAIPEKFPILFAIKLKLVELTLAEQNKPSEMAPITMHRAIKRDVQSKFSTTSSSYENVAYISKFIGRKIVDNIVEIAVIVTDSAKSALNIEHHQLE